MDIILYFFAEFEPDEDSRILPATYCSTKKINFWFCVIYNGNFWEITDKDLAENELTLVEK